MLSKSFSPEMKRSEKASCLKCEKLYTSCNSWVREGILSPHVVVCNYARWGCEKYVGEGQFEFANSRIMVLEELQRGELISVQRISDKLKLERGLVTTNISRLQKKGLKLRREENMGETYYQLTK